MYNDDDYTTENHPAYGMLSFSRCNGNPGSLFGSRVSAHNGYIQMRLVPAERIQEGKETRYQGKAISYIEVNMTHIQFAELITTMNFASGVPCTITRMTGKTVEPIPENLNQLEQETIKEKFKEELINKTSKLRENEARLDELLNKTSPLTKKEKEEIRGLYKDILRHFEANATFTLRRFTESTNAVVNEAKAHVDQFVTTVLTNVGLDTLKNKFMSKALLKDMNEDSVMDALPERSET